ncbi:hypothetical protein [Pedobacter antarcticus]|uniref:hypothetical protein n=1 Tax=Pedobacter antarcticus TaxID=34086 RepID=UPI001C5A27A2|nr:hypothetical protein [Pedobacter antarcticus]
MKKNIQLNRTTGQTKKLKNFICDLLLKLIASPDGTVAPTRLKLLILYRYTILAGEKKDTLITLPIALIAPTSFDKQDINGTGIACNSVNDIILNWFALNNPVCNNGEIVLSATLYSTPTHNESSQPLFVLDDVKIYVAEVEDLLPAKKTVKQTARTINRKQRKSINSSKTNLQNS